jgi:hypothetical protein
MKKRPIPTTPVADDPILNAVVENLQIIMGHRGSKITPLPPTASMDDVIAKVNEIIERLQ